MSSQLKRERRWTTFMDGDCDLGDLPIGTLVWCHDAPNHGPMDDVMCIDRRDDDGAIHLVRVETGPRRGGQPDDWAVEPDTIGRTTRFCYSLPMDPVSIVDPVEE